MVTDTASPCSVPLASIRVHQRLPSRPRHLAAGSIHLEHVFAAVGGIAGQRPVARVDDEIQQFEGHLADQHRHVVRTTKTSTVHWRSRTLSRTASYSEATASLQSAVANTFRDFHRYVEGTTFRAWKFRYVHLEIQNSNRKHHRDRHEDLPADLSIEGTWDLVLNEPLLDVLLDAPDAVLDECDDALATAVRLRQRLVADAQEGGLLKLHDRKGDA
jgi:DNA-directed RNA polymerase specialized sigma24 family protein